MMYKVRDRARDSDMGCGRSSFLFCFYGINYILEAKIGSAMSDSPEPGGQQYEIDPNILAGEYFIIGPSLICVCTT